MEITVGPFNLDALMSMLENLSGKQLETLSVNQLPPLHYLATAPANAFGLDRLDKIIKHFKNTGYDLNQQTNKYSSLGFTPLLVGIERRNLSFVECLLQNGVRLDICDQKGCSPLHWAARMDDFTIFRKLIKVGAFPPSNNQEVSDDIHLILHTLVDHGALELANYLLRQDLVDPNREAIYNGYLPRCLLNNRAISAAMEIFQIKRFAADASTNVALIRRFPPDEAFAWNLSTWNNLLPSALEPISMRFTPLARAVRGRKVPLMETLLENGAKISGSSEVHYCILHGLMDIAALLKDQTSALDLSNDKIEGMWALHCINEKVFSDQHLVGKTIEVIDTFVEAGWDLNSVGKCLNYFQEIGEFKVDPSTEFSLLHLACYFKSPVLVKHLLEKGADVNSKTNGRDILHPLQISILREDWSSMKSLMASGADVYAVGGFSSPSKLEFTSIDLLLKPPFRKVLIGKNWWIVLEVIIQLCSLETVKIDDLTWLPIQNGRTGSTKNVPSVYWLIRQFAYSLGDPRADLARLVELMGRKGYDFTLKCIPNTNDSHPILCKHLIFYVLRIEMPGGWLRQDLPLLENLLKFDKVALNVRNSEGLNPVEYVLQEWGCRTSWDVQRKVAALKILIESGVSVSKVKIGEDFNYFQGFLPVMKTLCCLGASIEPRAFQPREHFLPRMRVNDFDNRRVPWQVVRQELEELVRWKEKFDKDRKITLMYLCVLQVREMLGTVGALRMLDGEVPATVKEEVAGKKGYF